MLLYKLHATIPNSAVCILYIAGYSVCLCWLQLPTDSATVGGQSESIANGAKSPAGI